MENEDEVYYEEIETEDYGDDDFTVSDGLFFGSVLIGGCVIIAFLSAVIKRTFSNIHLKLGDKVEIGVETKE